VALIQSRDLWKNLKDSSHYSSSGEKDMADVQTISVVVAATSVVIAAIALVIQGKKAEKARKTELIAQLFSPLSSPTFTSQWDDIVHHWEWTDYDDFLNRYILKNSEATKYISMASFFGCLGLLVEMGLLDINIVHKWAPEACMSFWEKLEPVVKEQKKRLKAQGRMVPKIWENVEYLYNELQMREQRLQQIQP
jgi:hypothetical protein